MVLSAGGFPGLLISRHLPDIQKHGANPESQGHLLVQKKDVGKMVISLDLENSFYPLVVCYIAIGNGPSVVDLPIQDCDFPSLFVCLPEANCPVVQVVLYRHPTTFFIKKQCFLFRDLKKTDLFEDRISHSIHSLIIMFLSSNYHIGNMILIFFGCIPD